MTIADKSEITTQRNKSKIFVKEWRLTKYQYRVKQTGPNEITKENSSNTTVENIQLNAKEIKQFWNKI